MLEKSENQAGCEFRYVSLLGRSRCGRRTTYRVCITSSSASSCVSPIAGYSCSLSPRRQQSGIDPGQYLSCRLPFLYSPQLRKSPMLRGIPPGNSRTRAPSRKRAASGPVPTGHRFRMPRRTMLPVNWVFPRTPFPRALPLGVPGASDCASFRPKRDGQSAVPPRYAVPPQHGDLPPDAGFFARVIRHKLPKIYRHRWESSGSSGGQAGRARSARSWLWSIRSSSQPIAPVRPPVSVSYLSPSASALTRSARLTMPTIRP